MSKSPPPSVSVITATLNSETTIERCLRSVSEQTYARLEHWLIDGNSTDRTVPIAEQFQQKNNRLHIISETDRGVYDALNKGIHRSSGEWLYFLGGDDVMEPGVVQALFDNVDASQADFVYCDVRMKGSGQIYGGEFDSARLAGQNICHQAIFVRRELFSRFGLFNLKYPLGADWVFNWQCFGDPAVRIQYVPVTVAEFNENGRSTGKDERFFRDAPKLLLKHLSASMSADQLHTHMWTRLENQLPKMNLIEGLGLILRAGLYTRRRGQYARMAIDWLVTRQ